MPCELFSQFKTNCPEPFVALPLKTTFPLPFGSRSISVLESEIISAPFTSKSPPSCGEVSATTLAIPLPPPPGIVIVFVAVVPVTVTPEPTNLMLFLR